MNLPLQISFRDVPPSEAIEAKVRERVAKLERYYDRIMGCRVVIEAPHRRHHQGKLYHVRVDLTVPGGELIVRRDRGEHHAHEDVYVAIRDAFDAARRCLEDYARRQRGEVKAHTAPLVGRVAKLFPLDDYGFLETPAGTEVYFHKNSVLDDAFDQLRIGTDVQFVDEVGERGPQASTVRIMGKKSA
jgi:ribosomal subunit interface protein